MVIKKISTQIVSLAHNAFVKFHIGLYDNTEDKPRDIIYSYRDEYVTVAINSFATIEIKEYSEEWDPSKSVMITSLNIHSLISALEKVVASVYLKETFEIVDGVTKITADTIKEHTQTAYMGTNVIRVHPAVIYDKQEDNYYEGAVLYLNKSSNYIELHFSRLEALLYNLKQINFVSLGLQLFQFYKTTQGLDDLIPKKDLGSFKKKQVNIFEEETEEAVSSTLPKEKPSMDSFF